METKKRGSGWVVWLLLASMGLPSAYFVSYFALVRPSPVVVMTAAPGASIENLSILKYAIFDCRALHTFYGPANRIDRALLPGRWPGRFVESDY